MLELSELNDTALYDLEDQVKLEQSVRNFMFKEYQYENIPTPNTQEKLSLLLGSKKARVSQHYAHRVDIPVVHAKRILEFFFNTAPIILMEFS